MSEKKVLATLTSEESEELNILSVGYSEINELIDELIERRVKVSLARKDVWRKIFDKYGIEPNKDVSFNSSTNQITTNGGNE